MLRTASLRGSRSSGGSSPPTMRSISLPMRSRRAKMQPAANTPATQGALAAAATASEQHAALREEEASCRVTLATAEARCGAHEPVLIACIAMLASACERNGKLAEAADLLERALNLHDEAAFEQRRSRQNIPTSTSGLGGSVSSPHLRTKPQTAAPPAAPDDDDAQVEGPLLPFEPLLAIVISQARTLEMLGRVEAALRAHERAVRLLRHQLPGSSRLADALSNLAGAHEQVGELEPAQRLLEEALALLRGPRSYSKEALLQRAARGGDGGDGDDAAVAMALTRLGGVLARRENFVGAEARLREALEIMGAAADGGAATALRRAATMATLADALARRGQLDKARDVLESALEIEQHHLALDDPLLAARCAELGQLSWRLGDGLRAEVLLRNSCAIAEAAGDEFCSVDAYTTLARLLMESDGRLDAAREATERAVRLVHARFGQEHPHAAVALSDLAEIELRARDFATAKRWYAKVLEIVERWDGKSHARTASCLHNLACACFLGGDVTSADALWRRALQIDETLGGGGDGGTTGSRMGHIALALQRRGELDEARALLERAVALGTEALGADHTDVAALRASLFAVVGEQAARAPAPAEKAPPAPARPPTEVAEVAVDLCTNHFNATKQIQALELRALEDEARQRREEEERRGDEARKRREAEEARLAALVARTSPRSRSPRSRSPRFSFGSRARAAPTLTRERSSGEDLDV